MIGETRQSPMIDAIVHAVPDDCPGEGFSDDRRQSL